ncbi:VOC family protein [Leptolyngbya iicbica]|uniref:Glyoxalase/bleomycin resistance/dioxygenase family protein n=2 Tax=Cyanophyceae TaxID=3028117 RepID=A0A4Q7E4N6_9CYAN|nr:VOC family protein [Leptolyngbya sp. LK]RZM77178.1 glyoxalase/bleomycin resistance/dioxygenase family protein [Leptolyngbya sp. LK]
MINGIQDVYVNVADMQRAIAFYTDLLGCSVLYQDEHWCSLDAHGLKIGLHWTGGDAVPAVPFDEHGPHAGATITFRSDDVATDKAMLQNQGVEIVGEIDESFGHLVIFRDPDGNFLKLMRQKY